MAMSKRQYTSMVRGLHSSFVYITDIEQYRSIEDWRIPEFKDNGFFYGDCDDFACMVFSRGRDAGLSMRVVTCRVPVRGGWAGHAVAYCEEFNLVADNMYSSTYHPAYLINVQWKKMSGVNTLAKRHWRVARMQR